MLILGQANLNPSFSSARFEILVRAGGYFSLFIIRAHAALACQATCYSAIIVGRPVSRPIITFGAAGDAKLGFKFAWPYASIISAGLDWGRG